MVVVGERKRKGRKKKREAKDVDPFCVEIGKLA